MTDRELIKTKRLDLTGEFEGIWVEIRSNPPMRVYEDFASGDIARVMKALATMTRSSNLKDQDDKPIDLKSVDGWREVSSDLIGEVAMQIKLAMEPPKATANGSPTPTPSGAGPSHASTT